MVRRISISTTAMVNPPMVAGSPVIARVVSITTLNAGGRTPLSPDTASRAGSMALMDMISATEARTRQVTTNHGLVPFADAKIRKSFSIRQPSSSC